MKQLLPPWTKTGLFLGVGITGSSSLITSFHFFIGFFLRKTGGILGKKLIRRIELPFLLKSSRLALDKVLAMGVGKVGWSHPQ